MVQDRRSSRTPKYKKKTVGEIRLCGLQSHTHFSRFDRVESHDSLRSVGSIFFIHDTFFACVKNCVLSDGLSLCVDAAGGPSAVAPPYAAAAVFEVNHFFASTCKYASPWTFSIRLFLLPIGALGILLSSSGDGRPRLG